jgi:hypothetical protein
MPASGPITMQQVAIECQQPQVNFVLSQNGTEILAMKFTKPISMFDFYGKTYAPPQI